MLILALFIVINTIPLCTDLWNRAMNSLPQTSPGITKLAVENFVEGDIARVANGVYLPG